MNLESFSSFFINLNNVKSSFSSFLRGLIFSISIVLKKISFEPLRKEGKEDIAGLPASQIALRNVEIPSPCSGTQGFVPLENALGLGRWALARRMSSSIFTTSLSTG